MSVEQCRPATVRRDFTISIPEDVRAQYNLNPGDDVWVVWNGGKPVELNADNPMHKYYGILAGRGIVNDFEREADRQL